MVRNRLFALIAMLLLAGLAGMTRAEAGTYVETTEAWNLARIWKSAKKGKAHFYEGRLGLRNKSEETLSSVSARVTIHDPRGDEIAGETLRFGSLRKGKSEAQSFEIDKGVEFSELKVVVSFMVGGERKAEEFSMTPDDPRPMPAMVAEGSDDFGIRILSHEIDAPLSGRGATTLTARVRNMGGIPASKPKVTITFDLPDSGKGKSSRSSRSSRSRRSSRSKSAKTRQPASAKEVKGKKGTKVIELVLEEGAIPPGETRLYDGVVVPGAPEYSGYQVSIGADFNTGEGTGPKLDGYEADYGGIRLHGTTTTAGKSEGTTVIAMTVTNETDAIPSKSLVLEFQFLAKDNKEVFRIKHVCDQAFPTGKDVKVTLPPKPIPDYAAYQVGLAFEIPETKPETFTVEIKEGEKVPEGVEKVIEVPAEE